MWLKLRKRHFREIAIYMTVSSTGGIRQCWGSGSSLFSGEKVNPWWRKAYTQFQWIELLFRNSSFLFIPVEYNKSTQKRIYVKTSRNNITKYHKWLFQTAEKIRNERWERFPIAKWRHDVGECYLVRKGDLYRKSEVRKYHNR